MTFLHLPAFGLPVCSPFHVVSPTGVRHGVLLPSKHLPRFPAGFVSQSQTAGSLILVLIVRREFANCLEFPGEERCVTVMGIICSYNKK